ncbi:hypothetical protein [Pelagibius sp. Alg239-R121]|uniref:hypothetical protein n=1 Tax=Pelagibius sp. Alg239-R121 TaxID=2993448 RepID=UPI0024A62276|nr:hypothetical protein [Pelagibius sp. Alg239-R121]
MNNPTDPHEPTGCRWIDGHPGQGHWRYCQQPQQRKSAFCPEHHRRAYFDPRKREEASQEPGE